MGWNLKVLQVSPEKVFVLCDNKWNCAWNVLAWHAGISEVCCSCVSSQHTSASLTMFDVCSSMFLFNVSLQQTWFYQLFKERTFCLPGLDAIDSHDDIQNKKLWVWFWFYITDVINIAITLSIFSLLKTTVANKFRSG